MAIYIYDVITMFTMSVYSRRPSESQCQHDGLLRGTNQRAKNGSYILRNIVYNNILHICGRPVC